MKEEFGCCDNCNKLIWYGDKAYYGKKLNKYELKYFYPSFFKRFLIKLIICQNRLRHLYCSLKCLKVSDYEK